MAIGGTTVRRRQRRVGRSRGPEWCACDLRRRVGLERDVDRRLVRPAITTSFGGRDAGGQPVDARARSGPLNRRVARRDDRAAWPLPADDGDDRACRDDEFEVGLAAAARGAGTRTPARRGRGSGRWTVTKYRPSAGRGERESTDRLACPAALGPRQFLAGRVGDRQHAAAAASRAGRPAARSRTTSPLRPRSPSGRPRRARRSGRCRRRPAGPRTQDVASRLGQVIHSSGIGPAFQRTSAARVAVASGLRSGKSDRRRAGRPAEHGPRRPVVSVSR